MAHWPQTELSKQDRLAAGELGSGLGGAGELFDADFFEKASGGTAQFSVPAAALSLTGQAPAWRVVVVTKYSVPAATLMLAGQTPALRRTTKYSVPAANLTLTASVGTWRVRYSALSAALTLGGQAPAWRMTTKYSVPASALALAGQVPAWRLAVVTRFSVPASSLTLTPQQAALRSKHAVPSKAITLSPNAPAWRTIKKFALPAAASLVMAAQPIAFKQIMRPPQAALTLTGQAPAWSTTRKFSVPVASLTAAPQAPKLKVIYRPEAAQVTLGPQVPRFISIIRLQVPAAHLTLQSSQSNWFTFDPTSVYGGKIVTLLLCPRDQVVSLQPRKVIVLGPRATSQTLAPRPITLVLSERILVGDSMSLPVYTKDPDEKLTVGVNFFERLDGRTIASGSVISIKQLSGPAQQQSTIDAMLSGGIIAYPDSSIVRQKIINGVLGCSILLKIKAVLSDGDELVGSMQIDVQLGA